jgi:hypothetical protein
MYILNKRAEKIMLELSKNKFYKENSKVMLLILKKIIANEKLTIPRLSIFEEIVPLAND